ncbi:MAG: AAA family ATPase [Euryarchaeota archaeon]|jgi:cell division control protein 6|nr:AAA family ATPase [Euryarchaeota archaeon]
MSRNIFDHLLGNDSLFTNKEVLHHGFIPGNLPHRENEIESLVHNLVEALQGQIPSNMILYGQPGLGKTAVTRHVCKQLLQRGATLGRTIHTVEVNCCSVDTKYRVLAQLANELSDDSRKQVPFTGWPTDKVLERLKENMESLGGVHIFVLDEIDHLVKRHGDDILYPLTSLNYELRNSRCCVIGITNDLNFTEMLDARIASRLGSEDVAFSPYNSKQIEDILMQRARAGVREGVLEEGVIKLCSALAAQEHGDARRALDLLRVAVQKADVAGEEIVSTEHVRIAQNQLQFDQMTPVISGLPFHQKLVLYSILLNESNGLTNISTGEVYSVYQLTCQNASTTPLVSRSIGNVINNLDSLGLVTSKTTSLGRYGRSNRINTCIPKNINAISIMGESDEAMKPVINATYRLQSRL